MASALRRTFRRRRVTSGSYKPNPGSAPGVLTVNPLSHPSQVFVIAYGQDGYVEHACRDPEEINRFVGTWPVVWVNVIGLGSIETIEKVGTMFGIDRLLLEDVLDTSHRPKTEYYEHHIFTIMKGGLLGDQFESEHISIFLKKNLVIVFEEKPGSSFSQVRERIRRGTGKIRSLGTDYLYYALMDEVIDKYFPILDKLNLQLSTIEDNIVTRSHHMRDKDTIQYIHHNKSDLMLMHKTIWPMSEMISMIMREESPLITKAVRNFMRDCYDHCIQANELTQFYRDTATGLLNTFLAYESHKTNEIVKMLTLVSTIFMPLTFIVGLYGMNFSDMPELHSPYGYPGVLLFMLILTMGMVFYFRYRGWIGTPKPSETKPVNGA